MPHIVGMEQAAFVADRSIFYNTMLANELVRGYDRKHKTPRCVVKVDIRKAFDTVNWDFLKAILPQFGIPQAFCDWIIALVTSSRFSLKINGSTEDYFEDDLLVFVRGDLPSVQAIKQCLNLFFLLLKLSYAGKVTLLNSVIFGIEAYCWEKVCRARKQGGMGIREVLSWNKALLLHMFWKLCHKNTSTWMQWSTHYIFKQSSCWDLAAETCASPIWTQILKIRDEFVQKVGSRGVAQHCFQTWMTRQKFPLHEAYNLFHGEHFEPKWMRPILDTIVIPKHAFTATLAAQNGLATVDNICSRGLVMVNRCTLCFRSNEDDRHLFFDCPFSNGLLQQILVWQGVNRRVLSLKHERYKLAPCRGKSWQIKVACCALVATIHHIWQERNMRIFQGVCHSFAQILARIKYEVCVKIYAWQRGIDNDQLHSLLLG
ncbi:uncharacterized protein LOC141613200 [Silene latifolia]|uniref:uncharacterized protein LOC141613200 n=1 Tax=Silene latifolia TaxID=37657 RepID=UPI003D7735F1